MTGDTGRAPGGLDSEVSTSVQEWDQPHGGEERGQSAGRGMWKKRELENSFVSHHARKLPPFIQLLYMEHLRGRSSRWDGQNFTDKVHQFGSCLQRSQDFEFPLVHLKMLSVMLRNHDC